MYSPEYLLKEITNKVAELHKMATMQMPSKRQIPQLKFDDELNKRIEYYFGATTYSSSYTPSTVEQVIKFRETALALIEKHVAIINDMHTDNLVLIAENKNAIKAIEDMLSTYGIWKDYQDYSLKKPVKKAAAYHSDIARVFQLSDNYNNVSQLIERKKQEIITHATKLINAINLAEKEKKEKLLDADRAYLSVKYNIGYIGTVDCIISAICKRSSIIAEFNSVRDDAEDLVDAISCHKDVVLSDALKDYYTKNISGFDLIVIFKNFIKQKDPDLFDDYEKMYNSRYS